MSDQGKDYGPIHTPETQVFGLNENPHKSDVPACHNGVDNIAGAPKGSDRIAPEVSYFEHYEKPTK
jgi:hypothetical protein